MKAERKESLRKWVNVMVPALSLLLAGLMGPIAFTLKSTVKDLVRQELASYETVAASDARLKASNDGRMTSRPCARNQPQAIRMITS